MGRSVGWQLIEARPFDTPLNHIATKLPGVGFCHKIVHFSYEDVSRGVFYFFDTSPHPIALHESLLTSMSVVLFVL